MALKYTVYKNKKLLSFFRTMQANEFCTSVRCHYIWEEKEIRDFWSIVSNAKRCL